MPAKAGKSKSRRPTARRAALDAVGRVVARQTDIFLETINEAISVIPEECHVDRIVNPIEAMEMLDAARLAIENLGRRYAQAMGSYSWLFWLRRLPTEIFSAGPVTSRIYCRALAEVMSSWTTTSELFEAKSYKSVTLAISDSQLESLMKLCSIARLLWHRAQRYASCRER